MIREIGGDGGVVLFCSNWNFEKRPVNILREYKLPLNNEDNENN